MKSIHIPVGIIPAIAAAVALAACGGTASTTSGGGAAAPSSSALIHTASMKVGDKTQTVLKNTKGLTLYYFTPDTATTIACTGGCASNWPPLVSTSGTPTSDPALPGRLTVLNGANGNQVLYNGHPLYSYAKDGDAGDAYGQGVGGKWFVATPELAATATSPTPYNY
jgi:predicted lipoprotein with Yx(FWY)xxD motif